MPVQMVCDSTSLVSAALRDSLGSSSSSGGPSSGGGLGGGNALSVASSSLVTSSYFGSASSASAFDDSGEDYNRIENQISNALKRNQLRQIRYEEVSSFSHELDKIKSKYTLVEKTPAANNSIGGGGAASGTNTSSASPLSLMNGGGGKSMMAKLSAANAVAACNGTSQQNGTGSSSSAEKDQLPTPKRILYPREKVQIGWKASGCKWNTGVGFVNVGNTCYLNSTLQALFHVPAIANWLISDSAHREQCNDNGQECIICAMAKTLLASQSNQSPIKPYLVYSKLRLVCKHLVPGRQEDAHEFLRYLVEAMEKCYLARFKNSKELDQHSKETTPLNQILGGYLRSEVKCGSCGHVSTTFQHFEDLLLDIRKVSSIDEALRMYFARERLEEMQYKCEACKRKVAATKQFSLERAPFALCIQLKRFSMMGGKITKALELKNRLDLTPYSSKSAASSGRLTYKLVSMVTHLGNTQHCGHYTAIGGTETGNYYVFDDSLVRPISMQHVTNTNAYILFYELESVPNGIKPSATSTATLTSFANATGSSSSTGGKVGSGGEGRSQSGGGTSSNASPLRAHGSSSNSIFPSKLENRPGFIGPVLSQSTTEKAKKLANGLNSSSLYDDDDEGEAVVTSSSASRVSPISSTTSSLSSSSPVKQPDLLHSSPSTSGGSKPLMRNLPVSPSVKSKFGTATSSNGIPSSSHNGSFKPSSSSVVASASSSSSLTTSSLPSMPKLCNSPAAAKNYSGGGETGGEPSTKGAGSLSGHSSRNGIDRTTNGHHHQNGGSNSSKAVSLVPYDADEDDEDEDRDDGNYNNGNGRDGRKNRSSGTWRNGRVATAEDEDDDDDSDEDVERIRSHVLMGPGMSNGKQQRPSEHTEEDYSPKSPPVIKTKAGLWKVSDNRPQPSSSSSSSSSSNNSSNNSPATSGNSSPANYSHMNGHGGSGGPLASGYQPNNNRQYNGFNNGYNHNNGSNGNHYSSNNRNGNDVVSQLHQLSHRGYGAPVRSWNGQQTNMDRELANERREDRKRQLEDDRDTEMDRGRTKKMKTHFQQRPYDQQRNGMHQQNPFQSYQNHQVMNGIGGGNGGMNNNNNNNNRQKWNNSNNNNNGFGGKYHYQNNRGGNNYYHNGNHPRNHNGFRNGRHGRNGFYNKSHHHHQRDKF